MGKTVMNNEKIGFMEKGAFALANLGNIPIMTVVNAFLLIFYTDIAGLDPIPVATLFLIARVVDGLNDPIMGFIVDHLPKTKMGRFRPYLIIGVMICAINYLLLWFGPLMVTAGKLVIVYISYLLIGITFDLMDIPLNSMIPVMTDKAKERNTLSSIKGTAYLIGSMVVSIAGPLVVAGASSPKEGYIILVISAVAVVVVFSIIGTLGIKERIQPIAQEKYKFKDIFPIFVMRPVLALFLTNLVIGIAGQITTATGMYFTTYVLGKPEFLSIIGLLMVAGLIPGVIIAAPLSNKYGKKLVYTAGMVISIVFQLIRLIDLTNMGLFYGGTILSSLGVGFTMSLTYGIQADNVDYVEWKRNQRAEGAIASLSSFVTKAGMGIGAAIPGFILAAVGYVPNAAQSPAAITGITLTFIAIPALIYAVGAIIFSIGYKLDKKALEDIEKDLRSRRSGKDVDEADVI